MLRRIQSFLSEKRYTLASLAFIVAVWVLVYIRTIPIPIIQQWDESRNAVNTQEMLQNGNLLVRYFQGKPDNWELKPPMLVWLQCLSAKIFGVTEFGIRFPSALAALGIALISYFFLLGEKTMHATATLAATAAITMPAALHSHGFLFGDHDALLCFFQALMLVFQYRFLQSGKPHLSWLFALAFLMGWLTKSIAVCFVLPGIFILGLLHKEYRKNLFSVNQILAFTAAAALIVLYYVLRNWQQPGYTDMVNREEWLGRFASHPEANRDILYYVKGFYTERLQGFFIPAMLSFLWCLLQWKNKSFSTLGAFIILFTLPVISISQSKNYWYDLPLLFPIALCLAKMLNDFLVFAEQQKPIASQIATILATAYLVINSLKIISTHNHQDNPNKKERMVQYLRSKQFNKDKKYGVYCNAFNTDILFYLNTMNSKGYDFAIAEPTDSTQRFSTILMDREDKEGWTKQWKIENPAPELVFTGNK
ncbi:MAG: ArnT family glycosyltransferase [Sphingomonadales bacterium]|jgi:4-amino-4-deoxy-L-arabinose transferase-like glycosyltransferase